MPRRARVFVAGAWHHVYCRVGRGERPFADPREAAALVSVIREVKREQGLGVAAWCVMGNHYHLAVRAERVPLWRSMRLIQGRALEPEREDRAYHQERLALEQRLAEVEVAGARSRKV